MTATDIDVLQVLNERRLRGEPVRAFSLLYPEAAHAIASTYPERSTTMKPIRTIPVREALAIAQARVGCASAATTTKELLPIARALHTVKAQTAALVARRVAAEQVDEPSQDAALVEAYENLAKQAPTPAIRESYAKKAAQLRAALGATKTKPAPETDGLNGRQQAVLARLASRRRSSIEVLTAHLGR